MKNFWKIAQRLGILCFVAACGMWGLNAFAVIAASFGFTRPFIYFQYWGVSYWSVALPALGILAFLSLALREAFTYEFAPEEKKAAEPPEDRRVIVEKRRIRLYIRPT
jgi:formate hydrogenlyase subunit 3/multisubunit Na+/H+ antiporter MnhD subunit